MPSWWEEGAAIVIKSAKKYIQGNKIKWDDETAPKPTREGLIQLQALLSLLEQDCRKLLEWKDGGR